MKNLDLDSLISKLENPAALLERAEDILDYLILGPEAIPKKVNLRTGTLNSYSGLCYNLSRDTNIPGLTNIVDYIAREFSWYSGEWIFPVEGDYEYEVSGCKYVGEYGQRRVELLQALIEKLRAAVEENGCTSTARRTTLHRSQPPKTHRTVAGIH